jgi:hypothetical protein
VRHQLRIVSVDLLLTAQVTCADFNRLGPTWLLEDRLTTIARRDLTQSGTMDRISHRGNGAIDLLDMAMLRLTSAHSASLAKHPVASMPCALTPQPSRLLRVK